MDLTVQQQLTSIDHIQEGLLTVWMLINCLCSPQEQLDALLFISLGYIQYATLTVLDFHTDSDLSN